jgi:hypothetical protein
MSSEAIIKKCRAAYTECDTYSDKLTITRRGDDAIAVGNRTGRAQTLYSRKGMLRIDVWEEAFGHDVLWYVDGVASAYFGRHDAYSKRELNNLCGLISSNNETTYQIARLLMPREFPVEDLFSEYNVKKLLPDPARVNGVECYVLLGSQSRDVAAETATKIWVGMKDNLIRKVEVKTRFFSLERTNTCTIEPKVGAKLERREFIFEPPKSAVRSD